MMTIDNFSLSLCPSPCIFSFVRSFFETITGAGNVNVQRTNKQAHAHAHAQTHTPNTWQIVYKRREKK